MENYVYEKSFASDSRDNDELSSDEIEETAKLLLRYERELKDNPKLVLPFAHAIFEKTVAACDQIAKEFSGRVKAKVDYSFFTATVELWCCYVEFERGEFMNILHEIAHYALSVRFIPLVSGELHIMIQLPYFVSPQNIEEID